MQPGPTVGIIAGAELVEQGRQYCTPGKGQCTVALSLACATGGESINNINVGEFGMPVYAECAGLMYLCRTIIRQGKRHEMVGAIPADVELSNRPQGHGYVEVEATPENPLFDAGSVLRGHEFHHSKLIPLAALTFGYCVRRGHGVDGAMDGVCHGNVFAAYTHLHALGVPAWAERFVALAAMQTSQGLGATISLYGG